MKKLGSLIATMVLLTIVFWGIVTVKQVEHVLTYRSLVHDVLEEEGHLANEDLILAMIYTETKGRDDDLIQSSESLTGGQGGITDNRDSVRQGAAYLSENLAQAELAGVDVWTAVQAYNLGQGYINYVAQHGQRSTVELASHYSRDVVAPSLGNSTAETYTYYNPIALAYGGTSLYKNGGNYYYAKQVQFNQHLIKFVSSWSGN